MTTEGRPRAGLSASSVVMHTASHWPAAYIVMHGSYSASLRMMSTPHFSSIGPVWPSRPSMSLKTWATPKTLQEGYSLHASEKAGAAEAGQREARSATLRRAAFRGAEWNGFMVSESSLLRMHWGHGSRAHCPSPVPPWRGILSPVWSGREGRGEGGTVHGEWGQVEVAVFGVVIQAGERLFRRPPWGRRLVSLGVRAGRRTRCWRWFAAHNRGTRLPGL